MKEVIRDGRTWVDVTEDVEQAEKLGRALKSGLWDEDLVDVVTPVLDALVLLRRTVWSDYKLDKDERVFPGEAERRCYPCFDPHRIINGRTFGYLGLDDIYYTEAVLALGLHLGALCEREGIDLGTMEAEGLLNHPEAVALIRNYIEHLGR